MAKRVQMTADRPLKLLVFGSDAAEGDSLYEAMHANQGYSGIKAPNRLQHRYIIAS